MKQIFYHYTLREDFQNGMYNEIKDGRNDRVLEATKILSNCDLLYACMKRVTEEWKIATESELTNPSVNHQAFLGQAACNIYAGIHEDETRQAWGILTNEQRIEANKTADIVEQEWIAEYTKDKEGYQYSIFEVRENEDRARN